MNYQLLKKKKKEKTHKFDKQKNIKGGKADDT